MFSAWAFSDNTAVPINIKNNIHLISLDENTTVFAWVTGDQNKRRTIYLKNEIF